MMRNVLIICEHIAPAQGMASIRWTKLAKYLSMTGRYRIFVLTNEKDHDGDRQPANHYPRDPLLQSDMRCFDQYHAVPETRALRWYYAMKQRVMGGTNVQPGVQRSTSGSNGLLRRIRHAVLESSHDAKDRLQRKAVERYIDRHPELRQVDVVISSFGPAWPHLVGRRMKQMNPRLIWIADYRDPCYTQLTPTILRRRRKRFAAIQTGEANRITAVSAEMLPLLHLSQRQQAVAVPNGFDPSEAEAPKPPPSFSLLYTGTLYTDGAHFSDLSPAFSALKALIDEGCIRKEDISLQYAGNKGDLFMAQASAHGLAECVRDFGFLPRDAAMSLRREAAILLMATWNTQVEQGVVTGKTYEYMLSHKPILAVCSGDRPGSKLKEIITRGELGFCYEEPTAAQDTPALKEWLGRMYASWKENGSAAFSPNEEYVRQFGYDRIAGQVDRIIDGEVE